ncbi:nuclear transport factor 2 family protein [Prolixibacteraceae bacterium Z1-6]|uniref:Nuclear transport factor 2 family protein n=1 Tax=Draconibacterium aestuarii TaxID=2998507 RepID=A0A9X3F8I5_9BACT|nr:nuclear transport factor 2 family protein [Prolixibacteraceae bacterium Z1-6]
MKKIILFVFLMATITACQTVDPALEQTAVETTLHDFYAAMEDFNYDAMRDLCTQDFSLYETGFDHTDLDGFVESVKSMEGATINFDIDIEKTEVSGNMAFSVVHFSADILNGEANMNVEAYENYVFKKTDNKWLLHYCHSTHLPDKNNTNFASLHLLKVAEDLSVEGLQDALSKFNQVIAEMGFWDCGYTLMQVVQGSNDTYNYFIKGNWKNQQTYDIIHESEAWKKISDNLPEEVSKFFKNQVYLKISDL